MSQTESMKNIRYLKRPHMIMVNLEASINLIIVGVAYDVQDLQYGGGAPIQLRLYGP
jgi:hypothetical protein